MIGHVDKMLSVTHKGHEGFQLHPGKKYLSKFETCLQSILRRFLFSQKQWMWTTHGKRHVRKDLLGALLKVRGQFVSWLKSPHLIYSELTLTLPSESVRMPPFTTEHHVRMTMFECQKVPFSWAGWTTTLFSMVTVVTQGYPNSDWFLGNSSSILVAPST